MTREEAANNVRKIKNYMCAGNPMWDVRTIEQTLDMAIKALEQPEQRSYLCGQENDLISRQAAIDALTDQQLVNNMDSVNDTMLHKIKRAAQRILASLPSVQPKHRWIPCSERLPEEGCYVLITKEPLIKGYEREVIKAERSADPRSGKIEWWSPEFGTLTNNAVLAWMSLPEPVNGSNPD